MLNAVAVKVDAVEEAKGEAEDAVDAVKYEQAGAPAVAANPAHAALAECAECVDVDDLDEGEEDNEEEEFEDEEEEEQDEENLMQADSVEEHAQETRLHCRHSSNVSQSEKEIVEARRMGNQNYEGHDDNELGEGYRELADDEYEEEGSESEIKEEDQSVDDVKAKLEGSGEEPIPAETAQLKRPSQSEADQGEVIASQKGVKAEDEEQKIMAQPVGTDVYGAEIQAVVGPEVLDSPAPGDSLQEDAAQSEDKERSKQAAKASKSIATSACNTQGQAARAMTGSVTLVGKTDAQAAKAMTDSATHAGQSSGKAAARMSGSATPSRKTSGQAAPPAMQRQSPTATGCRVDAIPAAIGDDAAEAKRIKVGTTIRCMWPNGMWYRLSPDLSQKTEKSIKHQEAVLVEERQGRWVRAKDGWLQLFHPKTDELLYELVLMALEVPPKVALGAAQASATANATATATAKKAKADAKVAARASTKVLPGADQKRKPSATKAPGGGVGAAPVKKRSKASQKKGAGAQSAQLPPQSAKEESAPAAKRRKVDKSRTATLAAAPPVPVALATVPAAEPPPTPPASATDVSTNVLGIAPDAASERVVDACADASARLLPPKVRPFGDEFAPVKKARPEDYDSQGRAPMPRPRELRKVVAKVIAKERINDILETLAEMDDAAEADLVEVLIDLEAALERGQHLIHSMSTQRRDGEYMLELPAFPEQPRAREPEESKAVSPPRVDGGAAKAEQKLGNDVKLPGTTGKAPSPATIAPVEPSPHARRRSAHDVNGVVEDAGIGRRRFGECSDGGEATAAMLDCEAAISRSRGASRGSRSGGASIETVRDGAAQDPVPARPPLVRRGSRAATAAAAGALASNARGAPLPPPPLARRSGSPRAVSRLRAPSPPQPIRGSSGVGGIGSRVRRVGAGVDSDRSPPGRPLLRAATLGQPPPLPRRGGMGAVERSRSPLQPLGLRRRPRLVRSLSRSPRGAVLEGVHGSDELGNGRPRARQVEEDLESRVHALAARLPANAPARAGVRRSPSPPLRGSPCELGIDEDVAIGRRRGEEHRRRRRVDDQRW